MASDPTISSRTWQTVMEEIPKTKKIENQARWLSAIRDTAFDSIRNQPVLGTTAEQFLRVLENGTISTNVFLRRTHNFALDMNWLFTEIAKSGIDDPKHFAESLEKLFSVMASRAQSGAHFDGLSTKNFAVFQ
jgi:hypothetical protein